MCGLHCTLLCPLVVWDSPNAVEDGISTYEHCFKRNYSSTISVSISWSLRFNCRWIKSIFLCILVLVLSLTSLLLKKWWEHSLLFATCNVYVSHLGTSKTCNFSQVSRDKSKWFLNNPDLDGMSDLCFFRLIILMSQTISLSRFL